MSTHTTLAPASASRIAEARPFPIPSPAAPAPETIATRPLRERVGRGNSSVMSLFGNSEIGVVWLIVIDLGAHENLHAYIGTSVGPRSRVSTPLHAFDKEQGVVFQALCLPVRFYLLSLNHIGVLLEKCRAYKSTGRVEIGTVFVFQHFAIFN